MSPFSVAEFVEYLNAALASAVFPEGVAIEGEVAEYRVSQGKWIWFLLKDKDATVPCFATVWQLRMPLEDGMQVRVHGRPKVHPKSGKFSVNVEAVELVGEGALRRAFELLKKKLGEEGLFAVERKRPIPRFPARIGLIASGESAAYTDFLRILGNRWGGVEVNHLHVQVQGKDAVEQIAAAFRYFNVHPELAEVIVLTRGGGSMEDLQAFNSEDVARAVYGSVVPVVVGVGHERDETLADYAADIRASTPSNAAERVVPDRAEVIARIDGGALRMAGRIEAAVEGLRATVDRHVLRLDMYARRGVTAFRERLQRFALMFAAFSADVSAKRASLAAATAQLSSAMARRTVSAGAELEAHERMLRSLDPRAVLKRGYAVARAGGKVLTDAAQVDIGATVQVQLHRGGFRATVEEKE